MRLRIVAADDSGPWLQILRGLLETEFDVVATAVDGKSALDFIRELKPDVAVLDLEMPVLNGFEVTRELMKHPASPAVVICSVHRDRQLIQGAIDAGALGYVFKTDGCRELVEAVKTVAVGRAYLPPTI